MFLVFINNNVLVILCVKSNNKLKDVYCVLIVMKINLR